MSKARFLDRRILAGSLLALAIVSAGAVGPARGQQTDRQRIGLDGYCPVCLVDGDKWAKGAAEHQTTYDGITYYFPNDTIKQEFLASPAKYVPALGGDCVVCQAKAGKRVPGSTSNASRHGNRIFLFPSPKEQQVFAKNPKEFANVDLALNGECAVCLVHAKKHVAGKAEFTEIYKGFRYQFPSAKEQAEFRKDPGRYAAAGSGSNGKSAQTNAGRAAKGTLTVTGKTACAGCEFGVTPIQNPDELGLAVNTNDGKVVIVEQAHRLYGSVYKDRFSGQQVRVSGRVVRQDGRFTWIEPSALTVLK